MALPMLTDTVIWNGPRTLGALQLVIFIAVLVRIATLRPRLGRLLHLRLGLPQVVPPVSEDMVI